MGEWGISRVFRKRPLNLARGRSPDAGAGCWVLGAVLRWFSVHARGRGFAPDRPRYLMSAVESAKAVNAADGKMNGS